MKEPVLFESLNGGARQPRRHEVIATMRADEVRLQPPR
jgi:hypothetical protein